MDAVEQALNTRWLIALELPFKDYSEYKANNKTTPMYIMINEGNKISAILVNDIVLLTDIITNMQFTNKTNVNLHPNGFMMNQFAKKPLLVKILKDALNNIVSGEEEKQLQGFIEIMNLNFLNTKIQYCIVSFIVSLSFEDFYQSEIIHFVIKARLSQIRRVQKLSKGLQIYFHIEKLWGSSRHVINASKPSDKDLSFDKREALFIGELIFDEWDFKDLETVHHLAKWIHSYITTTELEQFYKFRTKDDYMYALILVEDY